MVCCNDSLFDRRFDYAVCFFVYFVRLLQLSLVWVIPFVVDLGWFFVGFGVIVCRCWFWYLFDVVSFAVLVLRGFVLVLEVVVLLFCCFGL